MRVPLTGFLPGAARALFLLCFFLVTVFYARPDEAELPPAEEFHPETAYLEMEIRTSSLMELAVWARELGLSDGGTREDLAARLRGHFRLPTPLGADFVEQRLITIESATTTEYFTLEVVNEEYARFRGNVIISLRDGNTVHRISAGEILFNRTRNVLTASGRVEYIREEGNTIETFQGDSITINLDNWAGIFIDGISERTIEGRPTAYRFAGTIISRDAEGATLLRNAEITNPASEEVFWSISASKLWLLPGHDFAILNAVLRVGNIPVFYIPFFFFPADQIVFRPVLGFRSREGTFFQTTTYILGRPRTETIMESSIAMIFGGAGDDMETRREGIFLRTTGERRQDTDEVRLSILFDTYVNLGVYLGTELALPSRGPWGETTISAGLGLTRNIYPMANTNTPFPNFDGVSEWNRSMFFSEDVPLRYRFRLTGSYQVRYGSLSWEFPFYSDPFVDRDFMRRPQPRDWFSMLREAAEGAEEDPDADTFLPSYEWRLSGSFNFPLAQLRPAITTLSISNISSSLLFGTRDSRRYLADLNNPLTPPNPGMRFFFPQRFTMYSLSVTMAGTPFTFGAAPPRHISPMPAQEAPGIALLPDLPISPWETPPDAGAAGMVPGEEHHFSPPALAQTFHLRTVAGPRLSIDYRLTPTTAAEMQFRSSQANWEEQEDIDWGQISSILSRFRTDGNLGFVVDHAGGGAYTIALRFFGTGAWQGYMFLNEDAEEFAFISGPNIGQPDPDRIRAAQDRAARETLFTSSWDFSTTVRPFFQSEVWGNTDLRYNVQGLLARNTFDTAARDRSWEMGSWDSDNINRHQLRANVAANVRDHHQNIIITTELPPTVEIASADATFRKWISETNIRTRVREPWDDDLREFERIYVTETLRFTPRTNFQQQIVFDPERNQYTTLISRLNIFGFSASYSVLYARPWNFNQNFYVGSGLELWEQSPYARLEPHEFRLGYDTTFRRENLWGRRLAFSVRFDTNMTFDLQRYTSSRLDFGMTITTHITNFLDFSFSTVSENAVMFRYFQNSRFFSAPPDDIYRGQETNFFVDLANSFRFDDPELRRSSGFNLRSINFSLLHHLGDWNARLTIHSTPQLDRTDITRPMYRFRNDISFLVQWVPIGEIRTQIDYSQNRLTVR